MARRHDPHSIDFEPGPMELDGDLFTGMDPEEDGVDEVNPVNPVDRLEEKPTLPPSLVEQSGLITLNQALIGKVTDPIPPGGRSEVMTLRTPSDDLASAFTLVVGQVGIPPSPNMLDGPDTNDYERYVVGQDAAGPATVIAHNYAVIEFGAGGASFKMLVDIVPEQVLNIPGSYVRIIGVNNSQGVSAGPIQVQAQVSLLPQAKRKVKFTTPSNLIAPLGLFFAGQLAPAVIPPFAQSVQVFTSGVLAEITFRNDAGTIVGRVQVPPLQISAEIPVPGNATRWAIQNMDAANPGYIMAVWTLGN